jgi:predicted nucleic acid-binding protein
MAHSSKLKETSMNHNMRPFSLLLNDSFMLLNAEMNNNNPQRKKLCKLGNFNATANSVVCSLTFILHNFSNFLEEHSLSLNYILSVCGGGGVTTTSALSLSRILHHYLQKKCQGRATVLKKASGCHPG